jgi:rhodanese-related sulfurtransferase
MVATITPQELKAKMDNKAEFLLLDVREPDEYEEYNLGGKLMPLGDLLVRLDELESWRDKDVVVHCRSGKRSEAACEVMAQMGFNQVHNLQGGVMGWIQAFGM